MPTLSDLSREMPSEGDLAAFGDIVEQEPSDRSAAIMSASLVEHALYAALCCRFVDAGETFRNTWFQDPTAPLGTFSAKIKLGHALGIYGHQTEKRLNRVRDIRNVFAHRAAPIDFSNPTVAKEVAAFGPPLRPLKNVREGYWGACLALAQDLIRDSLEHGGKEIEVKLP